MNMLVNLFGFIETRNFLDELFDHFILKKSFGLLCSVGYIYIYIYLFIYLYIYMYMYIVPGILLFKRKASGLFFFLSFFFF